MALSKVAVMLGAVLSLSGCATFQGDYVSPPGATSADKDRAFASCRAKSDRAPVMTVSTENWTYSGMVYENLMTSCMEVAGYRPVLQMP
jgi:hypothetical protein